MEGLSAKEVGAIMGLNERAVKSRLHRARLFVRRELSARGLADNTGSHRPEPIT
jgi:RNA polymerase sigma-70 factor (ECF subfamily)